VERGTAPSEPLVPSGDLVAEANSSALEQCRDRGAEDSVCFESHGRTSWLFNSLPGTGPEAEESKSVDGGKHQSVWSCSVLRCKGRTEL
jgi:hypothetical protein